MITIILSQNDIIIKNILDCLEWIINNFAVENSPLNRPMPEKSCFLAMDAAFITENPNYN